MRFIYLIVVLVACGSVVQAQSITDIITAPVKLVERAVEARSVEDIKKDNEVVLAVNEIMADLGTIKASTEIYEQRLLITGLFDNKNLYDQFYSKVKAIAGVKELYWHVTYMSDEEQLKHSKDILSWANTLVIDNQAGLDLIGNRGVADVNYRIAVDAFGTLYLLGRARSEDEKEKAIQAVRNSKGVRKVVEYVDVRP